MEWKSWTWIHQCCLLFTCAEGLLFSQCKSVPLPYKWKKHLNFFFFSTAQKWSQKYQGNWQFCTGDLIWSQSWHYIHQTVRPQSHIILHIDLYYLYYLFIYYLLPWPKNSVSNESVEYTLLQFVSYVFMHAKAFLITAQCWSCKKKREACQALAPSSVCISSCIILTSAHRGQQTCWQIV